MGDKKYSKKESLWRILQLLKGNPEPSNSEDVLTGAVDSEDGSLADIAELLAGAMVGVNPVIPGAMAEPYGGIWTWTGTVYMENLSANVYTKITGSFQNSSSLSNDVTCQPAQDRLSITEDGGYYEVSWSASILGSPDITYWIEAYNHATGLPQTVARVKPYASGSAVALSGLGYTYVSGTSQLIDLRVRPTATAWFKFDAGQLMVRRIDPMS